MGDCKIDVQDQDLFNWDYLLLRILGGLLRAYFRPLHDSFHSRTNNLFVLIYELLLIPWLLYKHTHINIAGSLVVADLWVRIVYNILLQEFQEVKDNKEVNLLCVFDWSFGGRQMEELDVNQRYVVIGIVGGC